MCNDIQELQELVRTNITEAAGHPMAQEAQNLAEGCLMRDLAIKEYFENEVVKVLLGTDPREKLISLTREVCMHSPLVSIVEQII